MDDKVDGIATLLKVQNLPFIRLLINEEIINEEIFMIALRKFINIDGFDNILFFSQIIDLIDDLWCLADVDKIILDLLVSDVLVNFTKKDKKIFTTQFMRLVDLGAIIHDYGDYMLDIPSESFFYYVEKSELAINREYILAAVSRFENLQICDWIFEKWESGTNLCDLQLSCEIAKSAYNKEKVYFSRVMQKLCTLHNVNIIIFYILSAPIQFNDVSDLMSYVSEYYHEIMFFRKLMVALRKTGDVLSLNEEAMNIAQKINDIVIHKYIISKIDYFYNLIIPDLTLLVNMHFDN